MKYQYPLDPQSGIQNPTLTYTNGSPNGSPGAYPPCQSVDYTMTEVVNAITGSGLTPSDADLHQLWEAIQRAVQTGIAGIVFPAAPTVPTYTGTNGVSIAGTVAQMDINSLPATTASATSDYVPILRNGVDEKIAISDIANTILSLYHQVIPASVPLPTPASTLSYTYPSDIAIGNNTTGTFPLGNLNGAFGTGDSNKFTFTQAGLYSVTAELQITIVTNYDANGNSPSVARVYGGFTFYRNGNSLYGVSQTNTALNYVGLLSNNFTLTTYFAAGETIAFTASGTGDSYNSNGASIHAGSFINITKLG